MLGTVELGRQIVLSSLSFAHEKIKFFTREMTQKGWQTMSGMNCSTSWTS